MERLFSQGHVVLYDVSLFYEGAFLRTITSFEALIEELFIGILSGALASSRQVTTKATFRSRAIAREIMLGGRPYVDWLPYRHTENRAEAFFKNGHPFTALSKQDKGELDRILLIRHAIAHQSRSAKANFEKTVLGSLTLLPSERTPSGFLRSRLGVSPPRTQYEEIVGTFNLLARKLCT